MYVKTLSIVSLPLVLSVAMPLAAFEITGSKWPGAQTEIYVDLPGLSLNGIAWNTAFSAALDAWNEATDFNFVLRQEYRDPCADDGLNGVGFGDSLCGSQFGEGTLAVTLRTFDESLLGPARLIESDVIINTDVPLAIYDGPQYLEWQQLDFGRIALHELGHVIGLDHENQQPAIMAPNIGDLDGLQPDDVAGVNTLYGGLANCAIRPLRFGRTENSLAEGDCRVNELTVGGDDDSFIDVYQFSLVDNTELAFSMRSASLDSVLLLADSNLDFFQFDEAAFERCDSSLTATLTAGTYFLLANTFDVPAKNECSNSGDYELTAEIRSDGLVALRPGSSLLGGNSDARFFAGISSDNGLSFGNRFTAQQSLDMTGQILIDPVHIGASGFLVVAAEIDGDFLFLNDRTEFVSWVPGAPFIRVRQKALGSTEQITIFTDLVAQELGIDAVTVDFYIGYGLDKNPQQLYFHASPFSLIIAGP